MKKKTLNVHPGELLREEFLKPLGITAYRLLAAGRPNGILYGPRSPMYMKDGSPAQ